MSELALREALTGLVNAKALKGVRELVAGWNGEGQPDGPYEHRHPPTLGARIETNCGAIYALDAAMVSARAALATPTEWQDIESARKVKPLEWLGREGPPGFDIGAEPSKYHHYLIRHLTDVRFDLELVTDAGNKRFGDFKSYEDAKAAATADHEARIGSSLVAPPASRNGEGRT